MEQENVSAQEIVVEQEEQTIEESPIVEETQYEDVVTLSKKDYSSMQRKAIAYDATKKAPQQRIITNQSSLNEDKVWEIADYIREGYSREDVDFIMRNGGKKALENPQSIVSIAIKAKKEQRKAETEANKLTDTSSMSEIERKYTPAQLEAMTSEELEKILPHAE